MFCIYVDRGLRCYSGEYVKFCMCIDRGCVVTWEGKLCSVCLLTDCVLLQG